MKKTSLFLTLFTLLIFPLSISINKSAKSVFLSSTETKQLNNVKITKNELIKKKTPHIRKQYQVTTTKQDIFKEYYEKHHLARVVVVNNKIVKNKKFGQDSSFHPLNDLKTIKLSNTEIKKGLPSKIQPKHQFVNAETDRKSHSKKKRINITSELNDLQKIVDELEKKSKVIKKQTSQSTKRIIRNDRNIEQVGYWQTVYSIESKQGKLLYRPRNKARNCNYTLGPCGHHQLTVQALRDIGCKSLQCRKDRLDYKKSLNLSKKLLALNEKRLKKNGLTNLKGYQKYLIHQQGANGIKNIIAAKNGKKELSKTIKKNMANNSPYSYKQYKRMGSKTAAKKFMQHWEKKWKKEQYLILASAPKSNNNQKEPYDIPTFNDGDLQFALNLLF